jgi:NADH-quinone oxidoreductase subunit B
MAGTPVALPRPSVGPPGPPAPRRLDLSWEGRRYSLWLLDAGLACCTVEVMAALLAGDGLREPGVLPEAVPGHAVDVLVVSGTLTDALAPVLRRVFDAIPGTPYVLSFGACSSTGGPYWDSYSVRPGIESVVPVDVVVPGCPPPPQALLQGLSLLAARQEPT